MSIRDPPSGLALILFAAVATAVVLARAIWSRLSSELSVRTDIVGYPTFANFNIERYFQRYWLVVAFVPLVTLGLFLVLDRIRPGLTPAGRRDSPHDRTGARGHRRRAAAGRSPGGLRSSARSSRSSSPMLFQARSRLDLDDRSSGDASLRRRDRGRRTLDPRPPRHGRLGTVGSGQRAGRTALDPRTLRRGRGTRVVGPDREWSFHWLPAWLALALTLAALGWIAAADAPASRAARNRPPSRDRDLRPCGDLPERFLLPGALGGMDMFHEGESPRSRRAPAGRGISLARPDLHPRPARRCSFASSSGMTIFEDSRWGAAAGEGVLLVPLYWIMVYAFCAYVFRSNWLFLLASQVAVFAGVAGIAASEFDFLFGTELRFLPLPLVLISLIALLRRATAARAALFAGIALIQSILSPEAAIAAVIFFLAVVAYEAVGFQRRLPLRQHFRRTGLTLAFGSVQLAVWCAFLAWHGALDDFFNVYLTFSSSHELTGGIPLQPTGADGYWLAMYVPPAAALVMLGLVVALAVRRQRISADDWGVAAMALFVLAYYHKFLTRPDAAHAFQVAAVSLPLVLYVGFRFVDAMDHLLTRIELPTSDLRIPRPATIAALVLVAAMNAPVIGRTLESLPTRLASDYRRSSGAAGCRLRDAGCGRPDARPRPSGDCALLPRTR